MKSILFVDKSFLKPPVEHLRGVELFNINFIQDLLKLEFKIVIVAERGWQETFEREFAGFSEVDYFYTKHFVADSINLLRVAFKIIMQRAKYEILMLGNVGNGIVPGVYLLHLCKVFSQSAVIANREASGKFVRLASSLNTTVVAVNRQITEPFKRIGLKNVFVDYGILNPELFFAEKNKSETDKVNFCMIGMLDNAWKGSDTAVEAFRALPEEVRASSNLHLGSYSNPPEYPEENIITYPWFSYEEIPEFLRKMDIALVLSRDEHIMRETFSQAIVQEMLTELPIVATDLEIFVEKLDEGGGYIAKNLPQITNAMLELYSNRDNRLEVGAQARKIGLERYVWDTKRFVKRYFTLNSGS